ncbi:sensor histidine kinase [Amycolatopsis thermoflava]
MQLTETSVVHSGATRPRVPDCAAQHRIAESTAAFRLRLAGELCERVQARLVNVLIALQLTRERVPPPQAELIDEAVEQARTAIAELRDLVAGLRPAVLAECGLPAAAEALGRRLPLPVDVVSTLPGRLPPAVEAHAYFFVSEALTNVVKHACATRATVALTADGNVLEIGVSDDGIGGAGTTGTGSGLPGLADRIAALGGEFAVSSPAGRGTRLRARIPVP